MKIYDLKQICAINNFDALFKRIEAGFLAYSKGLVNVPPVCHMDFENPTGDLHIKCASRNDEDYYVVKIASFFPQNVKQGLKPMQGMMLLFNRITGVPVALFQDEGYLTSLRTGIAGAICAKYFAPQNLQAIGIIGCGSQARFQLRSLAHVNPCRQVWVWAPNPKQMAEFKGDQTLKHFNINLAASARDVAQRCKLIVTTTPAKSPLLNFEDILEGSHITAVGSDSPGKQELDTKILKSAGKIVVDSKVQCFQYGETFCALQDGSITKDQVIELGTVIDNKQFRDNQNEISVADLTGLGIQDLEVALGIWKEL